MIAHIEGTVLSVGLDHVVISSAGVGFRIQATADTLARLRTGATAGLHTSLVVREDSMTLYGFDAAQDREFFEVIQSVSGIGPRLALALLGVLTPSQAASAIVNDEPKTLQKVPGIGPKVAQRIVLELQNKVAGFVDAQDRAQTSIAPQSIVSQQVVQGLVGLGYNEKTAEQAVHKVLASYVDDDSDSAKILRSALQVLSGGNHERS